MGKKSSASAISKISSSSALANTSTATSSGKSSILKSSFAPSYLQLHLFASVIQSFESQRLRIHDTSNGRLKQQHSAPAGTNITCLDWGYYGQAYREQRQSNKKKRKRAQDNQEDVVVAYGTSTSEICMYSPTEGKVVGTLKGGHDREIRDFKFLQADSFEAWSIGGDGKLVQWNLGTNQLARSINLSDATIRTLSTPSQTAPQIICASVTPYTIDLESKDDHRINSFDAFKQSVHTLIRSNNPSTGDQDLFLAADHNRYINVYDIQKKKIVRTLVVSGEIDAANTNDVSQVSKSTPGEQVLAVVTRDGSIDLFSKPFSLPKDTDGDIKTQRKGLTRKPDASVKLVTSDALKKSVPAAGAFLDGPNLVILSIDGGVEPIFQKLRWQDEGSGDLLFEGVKEVPRAKSSSTLNSATMNGAKDMGKTHVNDARAVVVNGLTESGSQAAPLEIESSDGEEDVSEEESEVEEHQAKSENGSEADSDEEMEDADQDLEGTTAGADEEDGIEPSFGDMLAARHPETISIVDALPADSKALTTIPELKQAMLPSGMSLGTVLTQSLRTNDQSLLETCLHVADEHVIQNTILRLDSSLAANLLTKLAERLADRPGRYGHLLTWVQSTMIAHGGAIASQVGVASKLRILYHVLNERSKILPSILLLKGKLDMMSAQQSFRTQAEAHRKTGEDAPAALYIEGDGDNWSSEEDDVSSDDDIGATGGRETKGRARKDLGELIGAPEGSEDEDMPLVNGGYHTDESGQEDSNAEETRHINGVLDDEVEVSGEEEESGSDLGGEEEDDDDDDDDDDEEDSEMDSFINDGEISVDADEDGVDIDEEDTPQRPVKKSKFR